MKPKPERPILTLLLLIVPQFAIGALIVWKVHNPNDYLMAVPDKHNSAVQAASPKILLVGGSSVGWGSNSQTFAKYCGMPCVNFGINAGQGLDYRFNEAVHFANPRDTVVLSLEYYELSLDPSGFIVTRTFVASPKSFFRFARWRELRSVCDEGIFEILSRRTRAAVSALGGTFKFDELYDRRNFNSDGDFVGHHDREPDNQDNWGLEFSDEADIAFQRLEKFVNQCREKNVRVFYRLPCVPASLAESKRAELETFENRFKKLFGDDLLTELDETLLPDDSFFDTSYHLIESEKNRVSELLAKRLAQKLNVQNPTAENTNLVEPVIEKPAGVEPATTRPLPPKPQSAPPESKTQQDVDEPENPLRKPNKRTAIRNLGSGEW